jgi:isopentenyl diphosphate isomerase/L-lactate dehydrogenase-like FMN-dependent dehydrogenase
MEQLARVSKKLGSVGQIELLQILKALSVGAKACSGGRLYLYALAAAGQAGR